MSQFVTFTLYDAATHPLEGATPTFVDYVAKTGGARAQPTILDLGGGKYGFVATDSDVLAGVAWVVDGGASASPRRTCGAIYAPGNPFETLLYITTSDSLFVDAGTPVFTVYTDSTGAARGTPALVRLATNYLYVFTPSTDDLADAVGWLVQSPDGSEPAYYDGTIAGEPEVGLVNDFGVTPETLRNRYFSQGDRWSSISNPSETTVGEIIAEAAGRLEGRLNRKNLSGITITDETSSAWLWCRRVIRLMAAIEVADESTQTNLSKGWEVQLAKLLEELDKDGYLALGDGITAPTSDDRGPTTHISEYGLDDGDHNLASDVIPIFRKSDHL